MRPRLLDLFCKAGGAAMGYHRAGFDVVGVDHEAQPRYPFEFHEADALEFLQEWGEEFDVIHASPPCQCYSHTRMLPNVRKDHPDLLGVTRDLLKQVGRPWVIENVMGAPMRPPAVMLCGLMFGLKVFRHRWFESSSLLLVPNAPAHGDRRIGRDGYCCLAGHGGNCMSKWNGGRRTPADHRNKAAWSAAVGIDWMTRDELAQAIPPAYTEYVGKQLLHSVEGSHAGTR